MTGKGRVNIDGLRITAAGRIDQRQFNRPTRENDGVPLYVYDTLHKPGDSLPWHVWETYLTDGARRRVSRHATQAQALKRAEIERLKQPNRKTSRKLRHKLGIDREGD